MTNTPQPQNTGFTIPYGESVPFPVNHSLKQEVVIQISSEFTSTLIEYMLTQHISFHLSFKLSPQESNVAGVSTNEYNQVEEVSILDNTARSAISPTCNNASATKWQSKEISILEAVSRKYFEKDFEQMPPTEAQIAAEFGISLAKFKSAFKVKYRKPFYQVYMIKRMEYAAKLLKNGYKAVEVSKLVGYGEKSCIKFNKMFQKHFGITPKKYQLLHIGRINRR
jgi:AraC-like DNA-binding protein